jgi:hypothetical protein
MPPEYSIARSELLSRLQVLVFIAIPARREPVGGPPISLWLDDVLGVDALVLEDRGVDGRLLVAG